MTDAFDERLVKVTFDFPNGQQVYQDLAISARGRLYGSPTANECILKISNLTREHQNYIITEASPLKKPRSNVRLSLDVGRQSYGTFRFYEGYVVAANVTQPPDIGIELQSLTNNYLQAAIIGVNQAALVSVKQIAQAIAKRNNLSLNFQLSAKNNRMIDNYNYNGSIAQEIRKLEQFGGINAFVTSDNTTLVVIDSDKSLESDIFLINDASGLVGIPQVTIQGPLVRVMINPQIKLGSTVQVESVLNSSANGKFKVVQMDFDLANRDHPFWYILKTSNLAQYQGTN